MPDQSLTLESLGWNPALADSLTRCRKGLQPGRVALEDKHFYTVLTPDGALTGQVSGRLLHQASSPAHLPKVGDWVGLTPLPGESKAVIHEVLPRRTKLSRKVPGREVEEQILATNIDVGFVVQSLDCRFNPALLQRHLVAVLESGAEPVVVLNKADLCQDIPGKVAEASQAAGAAPLVVVSAKTHQGVDKLERWIAPGVTVVFIGASGVGKSTLINDLCGEEIQAISEVREWDAKGRHTTTWRELILLPQGGLVIDTPGMREFQMWVADEGLREAFADLDAVAARCRFRDCSHTVEQQCAVLEALAAGRIPQERYRRYLKLRAELAQVEEARNRRSGMDWRRGGRPPRR